ncbi:RWD domain-containing protein [Schizophyllum commune]
MSQEDVGSCLAQQKEEWEVLESIYPECTTTDFVSGATLKLEIPVELPVSRVFTISAPPEVASGTSTQKLATSLSMLPPILLHIMLPPTYPASSPPEINFLHSTHMWFPHLKSLHETLMNMWQPEEGVLYNWVDHIKSGQFLDCIPSSSSDDDIELTHHAPPTLLAQLQAYQSAALTSQFSSNSYPCAVCLTSLKGANCLRLACNHIFCRACLEDFWKLCIAEGDVGRVGCPDPACVKDNREAEEEEVARVVTAEELARWRWLREKRDLEKDPTIIHCPIATCQRAIPKPKDILDPSSGWDRFRSCPSCSFCFCAFCKRTWHGPITHCPISVSEKIVREYLELPEGSPERTALERKYGKGTITKLVATWENELANQKWIQDSTMACPGCRVNVEKSLGCNHMTCSKCSQHFCYRCGARLRPENPYEHFSANPMSKCFGKLFDFKAEDMEWEHAPWPEPEGFILVD